MSTELVIKRSSRQRSYGHIRYKPGCPVSEILIRLKDRRATFSEEDLINLRLIGYNIVFCEDQ